MKDLTKVDIAIVGAGMTGLATALSLRQYGLQVAVLEAKKFTQILNENRIETRVSAINHNSKRLLKQLGVWSDIADNRISPYYYMKVWDDGFDSKIDISAEEISEHSLGCIVENQVIEYSLLQKAKSENVVLVDNANIENIEKRNTDAIIELTDRIIKASLIVAADGANSFVRNYFKFNTDIKPYEHTAIVATLELEKPHNFTAYQRFYDKGVLAFLPLENEYKCSIVWSVKISYAEYLSRLTDEEFESRLASEINSTFGKLKLLTKRFSFPLVQRHAREYIQDKVVLVGDACHTIHPLAGQGVNLGFKDVQALAGVIGEAYTKNRIIGDISTLDKYQRLRKLDNTKMIALMRSFKEGFASENILIKSLRRTGLNFVDKNSIIKSLIVKQAL